jgi:ketosteroid isomerase-like protein
MTTTTDTNSDLADLARGWWEAFERTDVDALLSLAADDVLLHASGHSQWSGEYHGKEALLGWWGDLMAAYPDQHYQLCDTLTGREHIAYLVRLTLRRDGRGVTDNNTWILRVRGGLIVEHWIRDGDQYAMDEFFATFEQADEGA